MTCDCVAKQSKGSSEKNFKTQSVEEKLCSESLQHEDSDKMLKQVQHDRKYAFTLAEVLITLTILGVIAVIAITNIANRISDARDVVRVKMAYSILDNAIRMAVAENGPIENWDWPNKTDCWQASNTQYLAQMMKKYFYIKNDCTTYGETSNSYYKSTRCFGGYDINSSAALNPYEGGYHYVRLKNLGDRLVSNNGENWLNFGYQLKNGISIGFTSHCMNTPQGLISGLYNRNGRYGKGTVLVDINGPKSPNKLGYDVFQFRIHRYPGSLILFDDSNFNTSVDYCSVSKAKTTYGYNGGMNCANHVIKHGNMDYKYKELTQNEF